MIFVFYDRMQFFNKVRDLFKIEDLRVRSWNTLKYLLIFRIGSFIVLPGVDSSKLKTYTEGLLGILDTFLGGAFSNASIFGLGIFPYISASIAVQLLTIMLPSFQRMQADGYSGRMRLNKITKYLAIFVCMAQSIAYITALKSNGVIVVGMTQFYILSIIFLIAGTMFCVWLGDRISDKGLGNGSSLLITVGIVSSMPKALLSEYVLRGRSSGVLTFSIELIVLFVIILGIVAVAQATRKIAVQYAKQLSSSNVGGQQSIARQYIPFKLNSAGVMPIIFTQTLMILPSFIVGYLANKYETAGKLFGWLLDINSWQYNLLFSILIIVFTFFYTAITVNPESISADMRRNNGFIAGIQSGKETTLYIDRVLSNLTLTGALFLAIVAAMPMLAKKIGVGVELSKFFGGTSMLILVSVVIETMQQIQSYVLLNKYSSGSVGSLKYVKKR